MNKFALYLLLLSFIAVPAAADQLSIQASPNDYVQNFNTAPFSKVDINDGINVYIDGGDAKPFVQAKGDSISLKYLVLAVKKDTLYLRMKPEYAVKNGRLSVIICNSDLSQIRNDGNGQMIAKHMHGAIDVIANGRGKTQLNGDVVLQNLVYNGSGPLELYWVNSSHVKIIGSGTGKIYLAGVADLLDINIRNHTWVDAKQLHANRIFVKTSGNARADVWAKEDLSTLALDHSNIYYYNDSGFVGAYMGPPGNSLRMVGIDTNEN